MTALTQDRVTPQRDGKLHRRDVAANAKIYVGALVALDANGNAKPGAVATTLTDIALLWDDTSWSADIAVADGDLAIDRGLRTAILISLFTNAPARDDDVVPERVDRGGWWGDALAETPGDVTGSRLWLLAREKQLASVLRRAEDYAREALQWLIDDKIAASVEIVATVPRSGWLNLAIALDRPGGPGRQRFDFLWEAS